MEAKKRRITKADATRITAAIKAIQALTERTKKYKSTLEYLENVVTRLGILKVFYAANVGYMDQSINFPYSLKEWRNTFSDAKMIYTYARKPHAKKDPADSLWEEVLPVFELAIQRAGWVEGKEAIIE